MKTCPELGEIEVNVEYHGLVRLHRPELALPQAGALSFSGRIQGFPKGVGELQ